MKREYRRSEPLFSQCGLNCGLCPMYHIREESHCPGCGGPGRPSCPILRCAGEHGGVEFCSLCPDWPCQRYVQEQADSFIPHRNARRDLETVKRVGLEHYRETLGKKREGCASCCSGAMTDGGSRCSAPLSTCWSWRMWRRS